MSSNIGAITSPNNIGNLLTQHGEIETKNCKGIAGKTVNKYIETLENALIFSTAGIYDIKGKELLKTLEKNYIIDLDFRNMLLGYRDDDREHMLENIVFLELLRRDYRVYIGRLGTLKLTLLLKSLMIRYIFKYRRALF